MPVTEFSPRLHILLAREADYGVVIRRGPSKHVCTIGWDMKTNEFTLGQWLKGRIYERRCDLSPNGKYMIYFALNGKWASETKGSWTAISKTPYLKAIGLWPKGDTWYGGGLFASNSKYWIDVPPDHLETSINPGSLKMISEKPIDDECNCMHLYYVRLLRDGWKLIEPKTKIAVFEKSAKHHWKLRKFDKPRHEEHALHNTLTEQSVQFPGWEWADLKGNQLYWTEKGKLYNGLIDSHGLCSIKELYNFNDMTFEAIKAPY